MVFMWTFSPGFDGIMEWHVTKLQWKKNCLQREWIWCRFELLIWFSIVNLWIMKHLRFHWLYFAQWLICNPKTQTILFAICSFCRMAMTFLRSGFFSLSKIMSTFSSIQGLRRSRIELEWIQLLENTSNQFRSFVPKFWNSAVNVQKCKNKYLDFFLLKFQIHAKKKTSSELNSQYMVWICSLFVNNLHIS